MSDLASPLLVTMRDEAQAYVCFCALMARVHSNFHIDGDAMTLKFQHLTEALIFYDLEYFTYLQLHQVSSLYSLKIVCYCELYKIQEKPIYISYCVIHSSGKVFHYN